MNLPRSSGILLHPTSLPGAYGIGDLGEFAYRFVDFLHAGKTRFWQTLPLGPTGFGDSPYQSFSTFAGNPYLISPDLLLQDNLLTASDIMDNADFPTDYVDYGRVIGWKLNLLERAFVRFKRDPKLVRRDYERFRVRNAEWLEDYALFMALKEANGGGSWSAWDEDLRNREKTALAKAKKKLKFAIERYIFQQFVFFRQWNALRAYAKEKKVEIIGDLPIFVSYDSADLWANAALFLLDEKKLPSVVAGVPPDYFSKTGQLWGNPLYAWRKHQEDGYAWWIQRLRAIFQRVDMLRLDHFRGFAAYWAIPASHLTAERGRWMPGPGAEFFNAVQKALGELRIIAEDLGEITPDVIRLREQFALPGMKILQFAFSDENNLFLPHHYPENCVAYSGTHDNDTTHGWYLSASEHERDFARRYLQVDGHDIAWDFIRALWESRAGLVLAPMQDLLSLGSEARMNYPGRTQGNWQWRMREWNGALTEKLRALNERTQRASV
jgi:4-alpha-glucanotransferase